MAGCLLAQRGRATGVSLCAAPAATKMRILPNAIPAGTGEVVDDAGDVADSDGTF
jgi:hypothetical protein